MIGSVFGGEDGCINNLHNEVIELKKEIAELKKYKCNCTQDDERPELKQ